LPAANRNKNVAVQSLHYTFQTLHVVGNGDTRAGEADVKMWAGRHLPFVGYLHV
jgi:hypothetical protein